MYIITRVLMIIGGISLTFLTYADDCQYAVSIEEKMIVNAPHVNLRRKPSVSSNKVDVVQKGLEVDIVEVSEECENIANQSGKWVKIKAKNVPVFSVGRNAKNFVKTFEGWIFSPFVSAFKEFKPVDNLDAFEEFYSCIGDVCLTLNLKKDGKFDVEVESHGYDDNGKQTHNVLKFGNGNTYLSDGVFWFRLSSGEMAPDFSTSREGYIVVRDQNSKYCLGQNIDYISGNCSFYAEDGVHPNRRDIKK